MSVNPLLALKALGQHIWLDNLSRTLLREGGLQRLIDEDGIDGVTSNPAIFEKAIANGTYYREDLEQLRGQRDIRLWSRQRCLLHQSLHRASGFTSTRRSACFIQQTATLFVETSLSRYFWPYLTKIIVGRRQALRNCIA